MAKKSEKKPAIQFYPGDWKKDDGVQLLSYEEKGVWLELLISMFGSPKRGKLLLPNGAPMGMKDISNLLRLDEKKCEQIVNKILEYGVASRDKNGVIFNRRMVRDERLSRVRRASGSLGGNPNLLKQKDNQSGNQTGNQNPTPSTSSSSSDNYIPIQGEGGAGFTREQVLEAAKWPDVNISAEKAEEFFNHYDKQGWVFGNGQPVVKLASALRDWKKDKLQTRQKNHGNATGKSTRNAGNQDNATDYSKFD